MRARFLAMIVAASFIGTLLAAPVHAQQASLDYVDANHDGKVTWAEFTEMFPNTPRATFDKYDKGHKGYLDAQDWTYVEKDQPFGKTIPQKQRKQGSPKNVQ